MRPRLTRSHSSGVATALKCIWYDVVRRGNNCAKLATATTKHQLDWRLAGGMLRKFCAWICATCCHHRLGWWHALLCSVHLFFFFKCWFIKKNGTLQRICGISYCVNVATPLTDRQQLFQLLPCAGWPISILTPSRITLGGKSFCSANMCCLSHLVGHVIKRFALFNSLAPAQRVNS